jgi:uncharacterized protein DUF4333
VGPCSSLRGVRPPLVSFALLAILALALAACGDRQLDAATSERFVRGVVVRQIGVRVASVACPKGVTAKEGATFTCLVTGPDGSNGRVVVRQLEHSKISVTAPFLHMREVEAFMAAPLGRLVKAHVRVGCQEIVVVRKGDVFLCQAIYDARRRTISARMIDDVGHFRYRLTTDR